MDQTSPLTELRGIGEKTKKVFEKAGIHNIGDLLSYYPRTYHSYREITDTSCAREGEEIALCGQIVRPPAVQYIKRFQIVAAELRDGAGRLPVRWYNMPYLKNTLRPGVQYVFTGRIAKKGNCLLLEQPSLFAPDQYLELLKGPQPVYSLIKGLTNAMLTKAIRQALSCIDLSRDPLSEDIRQKYGLAEYHYAVEQIHFPMDEHHLAIARRRLVFDEFFFFIRSLQGIRQQREQAKSPYEIQKTPLTGQVIAHIGYELTGAQKRVWNEIEADMTGGKVCMRLIQGDVGSGKTILAFLAMLLAADNGLQSCIMVPTEVLARQHYDSLTGLLQSQGLPFRAELLTGSMTAKEKREACARIASGEASLIVGTHALIQEKVEYRKLALVVTDEQHRFGVRQRETLSQKGEEPHILVMSATPIPRTLAVILYADLDLSAVDELPGNRRPVKNCVVTAAWRKKAYQFIEEQVRQGHQAYIICPMVEENEEIDAQDVLSYTERLKKLLPAEICVEYLHGKMKPREKNDIMERFLANEIQVLVSTTVIEVGVNVPNATVMMVEDAQRFGLAQLHQLRGRVGRGSAQSYCIFLSGSDSEQAKKRLEILNQSNDGFYIAREDLKLRGPGELLGVRQSGLMQFRLGDVFADAKILQEAGEAVRACTEFSQASYRDR